MTLLWGMTECLSVFTPGLLNGMKELTLEADVITPNLTEACLLADIPEDALLHCRTNTDLLKLAEDVALRLQKKPHTHRMS